MTSIWSAPRNPDDARAVLARCLRLEASALLDFASYPSAETERRYQAARTARQLAEATADRTTTDTRRN